jgi:hypothetical protein
VFILEKARKFISKLVEKTNLNEFIKNLKKDPHSFAYVEDLNIDIGSKYNVPKKTVIADNQISHIKEVRPQLFKEIVELLPKALKNPEGHMANPRRSGSFIIFKQGTHNYGVILQIDAGHDYNFIRTVQVMPNRTIKSYEKSSRRTATPPSLPKD